MAFCSVCGIQRAGDEALCPFHHTAYDQDDFAIRNKAVCDLLHRGIPVPKEVYERLQKEEWYVPPPYAPSPPTQQDDGPAE